VVSLPEQLQCARRELSLRKSVYPRWRITGKISPEVADREIEAMTAIVATLETLVEQTEPQQLPLLEGE
jgi:hypothetical protein